MKKVDISFINQNTNNKITIIEMSGRSIGILDKKELLTGDNKVEIINHFFESGEVKIAPKNVGAIITHDTDFNFTLVEIFEKVKKNNNEMTY